MRHTTVLCSMAQMSFTFSMSLAKGGVCLYHTVLWLLMPCRSHKPIILGSQVRLGDFFFLLFSPMYLSFLFLSFLFLTFLSHIHILSLSISLSVCKALSIYICLVLCFFLTLTTANQVCLHTGEHVLSWQLQRSEARLS